MKQPYLVHIFMFTKQWESYEELRLFSSATGSSCAILISFYCINKFYTIFTVVTVACGSNKFVGFNRHLSARVLSACLLNITCVCMSDLRSFVVGVPLLPLYLKPAGWTTEAAMAFPLVTLQVPLQPCGVW